MSRLRVNAYRSAHTNPHCNMEFSLAALEKCVFLMNVSFNGGIIQ
jgi:hypothetical protein